MQLFHFALKMSITAILFHWGNNTPSYVTWRSRLATAPDIPTRIVIHGGQFTGGVHPPNKFVPEIVRPLPCSPALLRHTLLIVYFFKALISFIGFLDKCHTSVFKALITYYFCLLQTVAGLYSLAEELISPVKTEELVGNRKVITKPKPKKKMTVQY